MIGDVIKGCYKTVTLNVGTIKHRLQYGLKANYNISNSSDVCQYLQSLIQDMVKLNSDLVRCGVMATFNYINTIMVEHPSPTKLDDIRNRREKLQYITEERHGYFKTLVKGLYKGVDKISGGGPSFDSAKLTVNSFIASPGDKNDMMQRVSGYLGNTAPTSFLKMIGQTLADMIRCHIRAFVSELLKRVINALHRIPTAQLQNN